MKKYILSLYLALASLALIIPLKAGATALSIDNVSLGDLKEGWIRVSWTTNVNSTGYLYYGLNDKQLDRYVGHLTLGQSHSADMTGLKKGTDYYYKIVATDENGQQVSSNINFLDTDDMDDTKAATISNVELVQATDYAAAISFTTDEDVQVVIKYGTDKNNLKKSRKYSTYTQKHFVLVNGLNGGTKYYYQLIVTDKDKNENSSEGSFTTGDASVYKAIKMDKLVPGSAATAINMPEGAVITWESNVLASAKIGYGLSADKINKWLEVTSDEAPSKIHQAHISALEPNTTYYYQIKMESEMIKDDFESSIYYLKTAALTGDYIGSLFKTGDLVKYDGQVYLIYGNRRVLIKNSDRQKAIATSSPKSMEKKYFEAYSDGGGYYGLYRDGQVVKDAKKSTIYLIDGQYKRPIANWAVFTYLNYSAKDIIVDKDNKLGAYKNGELLTHSKQMTGKTNASLNNRLVKSKTGTTVYLIANGRKLPFASAAAFQKNGYSFKNVKAISDLELQSFPEGQLIF